jgi:hypothetical protein
MAIFELVSWVLVLGSPETLWSRKNTATPYDAMTSVGHGTAGLLLEYSGTCAIATCMLLICLKPTRLAALVSAALYTVLVGVLLLEEREMKGVIHFSLSSVLEKPNSRQRIIVIRGIFAFLSVVSAVLARPCNAANKNKKI